MGVEKIISNRCYHVVLNCLSSQDDLIQVRIRHKIEGQMKEADLEIQISEKANQEAKPLKMNQSEFLARRGFLLLFFRKKK